MPRYRALTWPAQAIHVNEQHLVLPMGRGRKSIVLPRPESFPDRPGGVRRSSPAAPTNCMLRSSTRSRLKLNDRCGVPPATWGKFIKSLWRPTAAMPWSLPAVRCAASSASGPSGWGRSRRCARRPSAGRAGGGASTLPSKTLPPVPNGNCATSGTRACGRPSISVSARRDRAIYRRSAWWRRHPAGRQHNQRMSQWEYGKEDYAVYKAAEYGMAVTFGEERGTSSTCPLCGHKQRPRAVTGIAGNAAWSVTATWLVRSTCTARVLACRSSSHRYAIPRTYDRPASIPPAAAQDEQLRGRK